MKGKQIGRRRVAFLLCLVLLLGSVPVNVSAAELTAIQQVSEGQEDIADESGASGSTESPDTENLDTENLDTELPETETAPEEEEPSGSDTAGETGSGGGEEGPASLTEEEKISEEEPADDGPADAMSVMSDHMEQAAPYFNYYFGDPAYNGNYVVGNDENGQEILELYCDDLEEIIAMAEEGMELSYFFRGTVFAGFTLEDLYSMLEEGRSFDESVTDRLEGRPMPSWLEEAFDRGKASVPSLMSLDDGAGATTLTASGVSQMSVSQLGVISSLGSSKAHGHVVQLRATGDDGVTYPAFCASYGGSYHKGYTYSETDYSECVFPNGNTLSSYQYDLITCVVNTYYKATDQQSLDYAAAQLVIWYIINNIPDDSVYFDPDQAWEQGGLKEAAVLIGGEGYAEFIRRTILSYSYYINMQWDGTLDLDHFSPVDNYPGVHAELRFWCSPVSNSQWIITWNIDNVTPSPDGIIIPYIDNYYTEKEAVAKYDVDITKESIITNELLDGIVFEVVESEASGYPLDYDIIRGTFAEDGADYPNASIEDGSFGQTVSVGDPVPYMDTDVSPSGGAHRITLTTDGNGHASASFVHEHTFKEFFSICYLTPGQEVDYAVYQEVWQSVLEQASDAAEKEETLLVSYMGHQTEMDPDAVKAIYDSQQVVYAQTREQAVQTVNSMYRAYMARTYTYTVTEQDNYVRPSAEDSEGNTMEEISLPKKGFRMDVSDAVTVGPYVEVVKSGGTMIAGGRNDQDRNTQEINVTDEPWYNQIFINKTDLESGSQILYDTDFQIYEYYQYKARMTAAKKSIYPGDLLAQYIAEQEGKLILENIRSASILIEDSAGNAVLNQGLNVEELIKAAEDSSGLTVGFSPDSEGTYKVILKISVDSAESLDSAVSKVIANGSLKEEGAGAYLLEQTLVRSREVSVDDSGNMTVEGGGTLTSSWDRSTNITTYTYVDSQGSAHILTSDRDLAALKVRMKNGSMTVTFSYRETVPTGIYLTTEDGGLTYRGQDGARQYVSVLVDGDVYTLYYYPEEILEAGEYAYSTEITISSAELSKRDIDWDAAADMDDYSTWGQDNYEIVRVTADIARQMGWSEDTIGMYTVHRLAAADQYTGTAFSEAGDETSGEKFGYYEYGTLYYTQANLGKFAIVEAQAPSDGDITGHLGNYEDREYSGQEDISEQKMVHYLDLCADTNQYATYMLTDGYKDYDSVYYSNYVEMLDGTETRDGYDADHYVQSSLQPSIGLERYTLSEPARDILNRYWDEFFSQSLKEKSGILTGRDSDKTDTYFGLVEQQDPLLNFVGTTINLNSFQDNDSENSHIAFHGSYTDTAINYHSYSADAEELNRRNGFNGTEYLQVGTVDYDNGAGEKQARFSHTEESIGRGQDHAFIDERTYGTIRFAKHDAEAERYVEGDLSDGFADGTAHGDSDLNGAVYSLYVAENNRFTVEYYDGSLGGRLFRAQPLKDGGFRVIWDGDISDTGFTDCGDNEYTDYPHAYISMGKLYLDFSDKASECAAVTSGTKTYYGIQHPDGQYGGEKHNGFFAVLEEQQVFIDTDNDGFSDTWTLQDVTLEAGAKVSSASIRNGELQIDGLYLGSYYLTEEIRDTVVISSLDNDDRETREIRWLSFAAGYQADTDSSGNPTKYFYDFTYEGKKQDGTVYGAEQVYVQQDGNQYSLQQVIKGSGFQLHKLTTNGESASSNNTTGQNLPGAGFSVYLISELSLIQDGTIMPAFSLKEGDELVHEDQLTALYDEAGNMSGYQFTRDYISAHQPFAEKYGKDYDLEEVNRILYVAGHGYYYMQDILDAYKDRYYSDASGKWDFSEETQAIVRMYENEETAVDGVNEDLQYISNQLNHGNPYEWYGVNGISEGWTATGIPNEYSLSELFTNYKGDLWSPELPWGAYLVVETTAPTDMFTVDPLFVTISDSSASAGHSSAVTLTDASFVASLVLAKRDAQSGQSILQEGIAYRIWDYGNNKYVDRYLLGENGALSMIAQNVFRTDESGRLNAVAFLEAGTYRLEELSGPEGFYNSYWDMGNPTDGETLGGVGKDNERLSADNLFLAYWGTVDFEVTTERRYQSSGIVSDGNLDYIYIGETYYNGEAVGKLNILKTGEVLVDYAGTDEIEYADEYEPSSSSAFNELKSAGKERTVFEQLKTLFALGTDKVIYRDADGGEEAILDREDGEAGETLDFVYEERPLAGAVYQITAAEDIRTQDGGENYWFREGDVVATVTTGADGEITSYSPNYSTASDIGGGSYDHTYYYEKEDGISTSLTGLKYYEPREFSTTGSVENQWVDGRMSELDKALYGIPAFTDGTIYPNTFYREENTAVFRRLYRSSRKSELLATDYVTRLEEEGNLTTSTAGIVTEMPDGYRLTWTSVKNCPDAALEQYGDHYLLTLGDGNTMEVKTSSTLYLVTEAADASWAEGDMVEKTAAGYEITHTDPCVTAGDQGALTECAADMGYTYSRIYANASLIFDPDGTCTLCDPDGTEIVKMQGALLITESDGLLRKTDTGYEIVHFKYKNIENNSYAKADMRTKGAVLTLGGAEYDLIWDALHQNFVTAGGSTVELAPDHSYVTMNIGGEETDHYAFDLIIEYDLHYTEKENIVTVENDGTLGQVSVILPLGTYQVQEIEAPYGFVLNHSIQTVEFAYADQIKEVVFNTGNKSAEYTEETMKIWESKGLEWFLGGVNTIGERLQRMFGTNFFIWGTYGDAEEPYYGDAEGFLSFYDLRVKAWSEESAPEEPDIPGPEEPDSPEDDRHPEPEEHQRKLGVGIYKRDEQTGEALGGARFGLYTRDAVFNVDGKLLAEEGQLLATAVTDQTGHANFAVDIALMSRDQDENAGDPELVYDSAGTDARKRSIDGNTAMNSGDYYIQEITPPDGYLIDDSVYDVKFVYDDQYTMYIPVYAVHKNVGTEVTMTKMDLTGDAEVPGARISLYKVIDIHDVDEPGRISHESDNLSLIDTWISTEEAHDIRNLLLSNVEWPRLTNQEERENIYVFREELPADGYASAKDMEFRLYQKKDADGNWMDENGDLYGWEVSVKEVTSDQEYITGTIIASVRNADDRSGSEEGDSWDYGQTLEGITIGEWRLVNENLVICFHENAVRNAAIKALREKDFGDLDFNTVYFEFEGPAFDVPDFYPEKAVDTCPEDAYVTYTWEWKTLESGDMFLYDDTTKVRISKRDIVTGEEVDKAWLILRDKDTGAIVDAWQTGDDGYDENGAPLEHYIEGILKAGGTYVLEEKLAPTENGYVRSNSVEFTVADTGDIQHVIMQDDFTKLEISKADIVTGEEVDGAVLALWSVDESGNKETIIDLWTTGEDGHDSEGRPIRHQIRYLEPGDYLLTEILSPGDQGYVTSEDVAFTLTETGLLQQIRMYDDVTKLDIYKLDSRTGKAVQGAELELYFLGSEFDPDSVLDTGELVVSEDSLVSTIDTEKETARVERLAVGWYAVREKKAPRGYILDSSPVLIQIVDTPSVQYVKLYNQPVGSESSRPSSSPEEEAWEEQIDSADWWNNVRTEDTGEEGFSILLTVERDYARMMLPYTAAGIGLLVIAVIILAAQLRRKDDKDEA